MEENWAEIYTCLASWLPLVFNKWIVSRSSSLWVLYEPRGHAFTLILRNRFSALRALCRLPILPALPPSLAGSDDSFCCLYVYTFIRMSHSGKQTVVLSDTVISVCVGLTPLPCFPVVWWLNLPYHWLLSPCLDGTLLPYQSTSCLSLHSGN